MTPQSQWLPAVPCLCGVQAGKEQQQVHIFPDPPRQGRPASAAEGAFSGSQDHRRIGGESTPFNTNPFNCLFKNKKRGRKEKRLSPPRLHPHLPSDGLEVNAAGSEIDSSNLHSRPALPASRQENRYYNFTLTDIFAATSMAWAASGSLCLGLATVAKAPRHDTGAERPLAASRRHAQLGA